VSRRRRSLAAAALLPLCVLLAACGGSGRSQGSGTTTGAGPAPTATAPPGQAHLPATGSRLESILQDDDLLLYTTPRQQYQVLRQIKALGVDVVKVALIWWLTAPAHDLSRAPHFDASDPAAYPWGSWDRYDELVEEAHYLGLKVYFQLDPPTPRWAIAANFPHNQGKVLGQVPELGAFQRWVTAVGRRYSGTWHDTHGRTIPRVSEWGVWNEPNWRNWLNPITLNAGGIRQDSQPMLYRGLVNAAWRGLAATGHRSDTILVGETANIGSVTPIRFLEDLYCLTPGYRPLTGTAATAAGCPTAGSRSAFESENPGLFHMTGYAHHPYDFDIPPDRPSRVPTELSLANIGELERTLDGIFAAYGQSRPGGIPVYLSEWGYVTNPPNPEYHTTPAEQADWLNQGEYMMWREPFVRALAQFLLVDVPSPPTPNPTAAQWLHVFATGLEFHNGVPKPALAAYRIPIWLPDPRRGARVPVWGQLRPADHSTTQRGVIDFQPSGAGTWRRLTEVRTTSPEGFLTTQVSVPSAGLLRLGWRSPAGTMLYSRSARVS
jgi:hypothetical protein